MARIKGTPIPYEDKKYKVYQNGRSFQLSFPKQSKLVAEQYVTYELLPDGRILVIPEKKNIGKSSPVVKNAKK